MVDVVVDGSSHLNTGERWLVVEGEVVDRDKRKLGRSQYLRNRRAKSMNKHLQ